MKKMKLVAISIFGAITFANAQDVIVPESNHLILRDANAGLAWYGTKWNGVQKPFANQLLDGPALFGYSGGALGIKQGVSETIVLNWKSNGNVGIGVSNPQSKLDVNGTIRTNYSPIILADNNHGLSYFSTYNGTTIDGPVLFGFSGGSLGTNQSGTQKNVLIWKADGSVGIGTNKTNGFKLSVAGKIRAEEIEVSLSSGWADYVFEKNYNLSSLKEVEEYINLHKHLPNVPSAKEVESNGINLGEMDAILLRKIEELTLYTISLSKKIEELKEENISFKSKY